MLGFWYISIQNTQGTGIWYMLLGRVQIRGLIAACCFKNDFCTILYDTRQSVTGVTVVGVVKRCHCSRQTLPPAAAARSGKASN